MKKFIFLGIILISIFALGGSDLSSAQTPTGWYVATNGADNAACGSTASPCATVQYVLNNKINAGETIKIKPGTYELGSSRIAVNNPAKHANITITAEDPNNRPWFKFSGSGAKIRVGYYASSNPAADISVPGVTVSYLKIESNPTRMRSGTWDPTVRWDRESINGVIDNLEIYNCQTGIAINVGKLMTVTNNVIHDCGLESDPYIANGNGVGIGQYNFPDGSGLGRNNLATIWDEKIYIAYNEVYNVAEDGWVPVCGGNFIANRYTEVAYNNFHDNTEDGIDGKCHQYAKIHHNKLHHNQNKGFGNASYPAWDWEVYDNEIYANEMYSMVITGDAKDWKVYNNLIYGNCTDPTSSGCAGIIADGTGHQIHHNVIYGNTIPSGALNANASNYGVKGGYLSASIAWYNNVIYNNAPQASGNIHTSSTGTFSNNYVYPASPGKNLTGTNSVTAPDPMLVNPSPDPNLRDFRISSVSSPLVDAGIAAGVTADFLGAVRPQGAGFDIGAYEYGSSAPEICTSFTYSGWGTCQSDSIQTRTITSSSPSGCAGGNPEPLTQNCTTAAIKTFVKRLGEYGSSEEGFSIVEAFDHSGYVIAGYSTGYGTGKGGFNVASEHDVLLTKFDTAGNHLWSRTFGIANYFDIANEVIATADGYAAVGSTAGFGAGGNDILILKYDLSGNIVWSRTLGSAGSELGNYIAQAQDGGYLITGLTNNNTAGGNDILLAKFNSSGSLLWSRVVGGTGDESGSSILVDPNGDIVMAGGTKSFGVSGSDAFIMKFDSIGNILWTKTYGGAADEQSGYIISSGDGGYILSGGGKSFGAGGTDSHVTKFDVNGNIIWSKATGSPFDEAGFIPVLASDGGIALGGWTIGGFNSEDDDLLVFKLDASGNFLWSKMIGLPGNSVTKDMIKGFIQDFEGNYVLTGESVNPYMPDVPLVKMGEDGTSCLGSSVSPAVQDITSLLTIGDVKPAVTPQNFSVLVPNNPVITSPTPSIADICPIDVIPPADINEDGVINIKDIQTCVKVITGQTTNSRADVNGDGGVNIKDIQTIVRAIIG